MRFRTTLVIALFLLPTLVFAQAKKKKPSVPAIFGTAQYVWVQAENGDAYTPNLYAADRQAIIDMQNALHDWNRYRLTARRDQAELVFIVRKGRAASATIGATAGSSAPGPGSAGQGGASSPFGGPAHAGPGFGAGGEAGPDDDILEIRTLGSDGKLSSPIWVRSLADGLDAPRVQLLQLLRNAVEKDYPKQ